MDSIKERDAFFWCIYKLFIKEKGQGSKVQKRYIPAAIMLSAGTVTCIISIVKNMDVYYSLKILLVVLVLFYILGLIARAIIGKVMDDAEAARLLAEEEAAKAELEAELEARAEEESEEAETEVDAEGEESGEKMSN